MISIHRRERPFGNRYAATALPVDGVLQDEHVGDEAIEGELKKVLAQAQQMHPAGTGEIEGQR